MSHLERVVPILSIVTSVGVAAAALYLVSFWSTFGVNIFQFIGIADIAILALYPILVGSSTVIGAHAVGAIIGNMIRPAGPSKSQQPKVLPPAGPIWLFLDRHVTLGRLTLVILVGLVLIQYSRPVPDPFVSLIFWITIGGFVGASVGDNPKVISIFGDNGVLSRSCLMGVGILFALAFGIAKIDAGRILAGLDVRRISTKTIKAAGTPDFIERQLLKETETLKFIGVAGDFFFFLKEDNTAVYALKYDDLYFLETWR